MRVQDRVLSAVDLVMVIVQALELMVEKCALTIDGANKSASCILLRVFECIASGLLLAGMLIMSQCMTAYLLHFCFSLSLRFNGHFPGEPGLAGFIEAKDDGSGEW